MTLHLQIDSLALTGLKIPRNQRSQLQAALEAELARLFGANGIPATLLQGGRIPKLRANVTAKATINPTELGQVIARSIYADLNPQGTTNNSLIQGTTSRQQPAPKRHNPALSSDQNLTDSD